MTMKDAPKRSEPEAVSALNQLLTEFRPKFAYFFTREAEHVMSDQQIEEGASALLAEYHLQVLPLVEVIPSLAELLMVKRLCRSGIERGKNECAK